MNNLIYNYVFVSPKMSDLVIRYSDLNNNDFTKHIYHNPDDSIKKNILLHYLYRIHISKKINKIINLPFKGIWSKLRFFNDKKIKFKYSNPICFIIDSRYLHFQRNYYKDYFISHLRKKYKDCKIVLYYLDILSTYNFDIKIYKQFFDAVITFDKEEALENNFLYYKDQPFSFINVKEYSFLPKSDVVFFGRAKNRLHEILKIFSFLQEKNIVCDFHIFEVPLAEQKYPEKIHYHEELLPYYQILQYVVSSNCILEILQDGGSSPTARVSEAIFFGKKLISNCQEIKTREYYNPLSMLIFSDPKDINFEFIKNNTNEINYNYKQYLSPLNLIYFINDYFLKK